MKNKYINKIVQGMFVLSALCTTSCSDFLVEDPDYLYTPDNIFATSSQVDAVVVGCYDHIRTMNTGFDTTQRLYRGNGTDMYDVASIRYGMRANDYSTLNTDNGMFYTNYSHWYQLIAKTNLAFYAAELPQISWTDLNEKAYILAQAKFFRGYAYMSLAELYGGVAIVDTLQNSDRYDYARATKAETLEFAIKNFEEAIPYLPETTPINGRIVKGAAQHYAAQAYLDLGAELESEGKSSEAKTALAKSIEYADQLIGGSTYKLMTERFGKRATEDPTFYFARIKEDQTEETKYSSAGVDIEGNVIWDMWQEGNIDYQDGNLETIWALQIDYEAAKIDTDAKLRWSEIFGPVFRDPQAGVCDGMMEDVGGRGVIYLGTTNYTRDLIYQDDYATDLRNSEAVFRRTFLGNNKGNEWYGKVIPWDVLYKEGSEFTDSQREAAVTMIYPVSCKINTDKYTGLDEGEIRGNLYRDEPLARLAETVLIRAEAKWRSGDNAGAAADINLIRDRAQCSYMVTAADINADLILDERARELVYEERRWNTLFRFGGKIASERIKKYAYWECARNTLDFEIESWPIPQSVIDTNKDVVWEQNPGW